MSFKVLVSDPLAKEGVDILKGFCEVDEIADLSEDELVKIIGEYDALIVRSGTQVTARIIEAADKMKYIGRAGVGVDNIDTEAATKKGIIVSNAPEGNTLAATEHTVGMMMALARNIPQATASLKKGEWKRSKFMGNEMNGKVLGVVGFGRIGREVAKRAQALAMTVIAYDPFIPAEVGAAMGVEMMSVAELFTKADVITVHTPLIPSTTHMVNAESIKTMKDGVRLINCARGGIIDEKALYDALVSGKVAGAALDVFEHEPPTDSPLLTLDNVIVTPHLGASTVEAQKNVAISVAHQCIDVLSGGSARSAVNTPLVAPEMKSKVEPYALLAEKMGSLAAQIAEAPVTEVEFAYLGEVAALKQNLKYVTRLGVKGMLTHVLQEPVNIVNAEFVAKERGLNVVEKTSGEAGDYKSLVTLTFTTKKGSQKIAGIVTREGAARIISIGKYMTDLVPAGNVILADHVNRPGIIGIVGTILGKHNVNISSMQVGGAHVGTESLMILSVGDVVPANVMEEVAKADGITAAKFVQL
ncbi:MAG TPA: phosphoglycerate dehydrogenase [Methanocorpusculum sp.]|nr:phosphoglycerate dehydrogenase [Methanocorpusculum sp.]